MNKNWLMYDEPADNGGGGAPEVPEEPPKAQIFKEQLKKEYRDHEALNDVADFNDLTARYIDLRGKQQPEIVIPKTADEYDFGEPAEGTVRDQTTEKMYRDIAFKNKMTNDQAVGFARDLAEYINNQMGEANTRVQGFLDGIGKQGVDTAVKFLTVYGGKEYADEVMGNPGQHEKLLKIAVEAGKLLKEDSIVPDIPGAGSGEETEEEYLKRMNPDLVEDGFWDKK